jgi:hypothetical protein
VSDFEEDVHRAIHVQPLVGGTLLTSDLKATTQNMEKCWSLNMSDVPVDERKMHEVWETLILQNLGWR